MKRLNALLACLLLSLAAHAASLAERSLFAQGHWWNPERSGSGFELFHADGEAMLIWYTYDAADRPIWYTAQGRVASLGEPWKLMKHQWRNGRKAGASEVGTVRLNVQSPEAIALHFDIGGSIGNWSLQPFQLAGVVNEVDHSGSWFDPSNSGWGVTVTEQGDVLGGVLYGYDEAGEPTWFAGFDRGTREVQMFSYRGKCPTCAYASSTPLRAGSLRFDFTSENRLTLRGTLSQPMAAGVRYDGVTLSQIGRPASTRVADRTLASFRDTTDLRRYVENGMLNLRYYSSGVDFSAAPPSAAAPTFSGTNLREAGVDESDLVKTDGRYIYTFAEESTQRRAALRIAEVEGDGAGVRVVGNVSLDAANPPLLGQRGLILHDNRLVAITGPDPYIGRGLPYNYFTAGTAPAESRIEIFDSSRATSPQTMYRVQITGTVIAARRIEKRLYVVTRFVPQIPGFQLYGNDATRLAQLAATPLADLLPRVKVNGGEATIAVDPTSIYLPPLGTQVPLADMVVVSEIDLASPRLVKSIAIAGPAEALYASPRNLYIATGRQPLRTLTGLMLPKPPASYLTDVHQVRLDPTGLSVVASGTVEGFMGVDFDKGGFRMSEHEGRLRIVTGSPSGGWWGGDNVNRLTILEPSTSAAGLLRTVAFLPNAARPERIGKPNELLYGVRFVGDRMYAVTFMKTDPLYVIDLTKPSDPRIAGALEIPGFSDYLHPVGNGLLLGFGKDAVPAGTMGDGQWAWFQGLQLTLFDVSDDGKPRELQRLVIGKRGSESALLASHHAFSSVQRADGTLSIAIPARVHDGITYDNGPTTTYPYDHSGLLRFELSGNTPATARLSQGGSLRVRYEEQLYGYYGDPSVRDGRSILFKEGTVFVGRGSLWHQDRNGTTTGPF